MPTDADVLIIGSGAGGLAAALALARAGLRVTICEAHEIPGGYSQSFTLDGLRFSPGIHYLGELGPGEPLRRIYEGLGLGGELEFCELAPRSYVHITLGQRTYPLVKGRAALEAHLAEEFPGEAAGIGGYLDQVQRIGRVLRGDGLQLVTDRAALGALEPWAHRTGQRLIEAHVGDRTLRGLFGAIAGEYRPGAFARAGDGARADRLSLPRGRLLSARRRRRPGEGDGAGHQARGRAAAPLRAGCAHPHRRASRRWR